LNKLVPILLALAVIVSCSSPGDAGADPISAHVWTYSATLEACSVAGVSDGVALVHATDGYMGGLHYEAYLAGVSMENGRELWRIEGVSYRVQYADGEGKFYAVQSLYDEAEALIIYCMDIHTGDMLWEHTLTPFPYPGFVRATSSTIVVYDYASFSHINTLTGIDIETLEQKWRLEDVYLDAYARILPDDPADKTIIYHINNEVALIDCDTGEILESHPMPESNYSVRHMDDEVFIYPSGESIICLSRESNGVRWQNALPLIGEVLDIYDVLRLGNEICVQTFTAYYFLDPETGEILRTMETGFEFNFMLPYVVMVTRTDGYYFLPVSHGMRCYASN